MHVVTNAFPKSCLQKKKTIKDERILY